MKTILKLLSIFCAMSLIPFMGLAAISSVELKGVIKSFDEKTVTIQQSASTVTIPRDYITTKQIKAGEFVQVKLTPEQFAKLNETKAVKK